jgi:TPR repeat protein
MIRMPFRCLKSTTAPSVIAGLLVLIGSLTALAAEGQKRASDGSQRLGTRNEVTAAKPLPLSEIVARANQGDSEAQFQLGRRYHNGWGVKQDKSEAARWFNKSMDQGHLGALLKLAHLYYKGEGVKRSEGKALQLLRFASSRGSAEGHRMLGAVYLINGYRYDLISNLWLKAAEGGDILAMEKMGIHEKDEKQKKMWRDRAKAQKALELAKYIAEAEGGNPDAMQAIGLNTIYGGYQDSTSLDESDSVSSARRVEWLIRSQIPWSLISAADMYRKGEWGLGIDIKQADEIQNSTLRQLETAAASGDVASAIELAEIQILQLKANPIGSLKWLRMAADAGNSWAAAQLLDLNQESKIGSQPKDTVARWEQIKADGGTAEDQFQYGLQFYKGEGRPRNLVEARKWFQRAAENDSSQAQRMLAIMTIRGEAGFKKDTQKALERLRKVLESGCEDGWVALGFIFLSAAQGTEQGDQEALHWRALMASAGGRKMDDVEIMFEIGSDLRSGSCSFYSVPPEKVAAARWFKKAAEKGSTEAAWALGLMLAEGEGIKADPLEAEKYLEMGCSNTEKWKKFAEMLSGGRGLFRRPVKAEQILLRIHNAEVTASLELGNFYYNNTKIPESAVQAFRLYMEVAENAQGLLQAKAQFNVALCYSLGRGVAKDEIEALAWLNLAASSGDEAITKARTQMESGLGRQLTLLSQQRSNEISALLESKARKNRPEFRGKATLDDGRVPKASGTGIIVSSGGYIVTAAHVVSDSGTVKVVTVNGRLDAEVVKIDEANDLAVLKASGGGLYPLPIAASRSIRLGQQVATIGFPHIDVQGFSPKVTKGEISSENGMADDPRSWQISVPVQSGNSGGPLLDSSGNLVGVVQAKLGIKAANLTGDLPQNVAYAVKSAYVTAVVEQYLGDNPPPPRKSDTYRSFEEMIAEAQRSVVLILAY